MVDFPGKTRFQQENQGKPFSGSSGIVPFYRTTGGYIKTPLAPQGTVFKKK